MLASAGDISLEQVFRTVVLDYTIINYVCKFNSFIRENKKVPGNYNIKLNDNKFNRLGNCTVSTSLTLTKRH